MATYRTRALCLRKTRLGEADLIVTMLGRDGCQIRAVAKGVRKTTSRIGARLEPFSVVDVLFARGRSLDVVTEVEMVASHERLRLDLDAVGAAAVVVDVLEKLSVECQTEERLYELGVAALDTLERIPARLYDLLVAAFVWKAMAMHGYRPQLSTCVTCGDVPVSVFSLRSGGLVCEACARGDESAMGVTPGLAAAMGALLRVRFAEIDKLSLETDAVWETLTVGAAFAAVHVPARLRALEGYLKERPHRL